jgi:RNA polymerase sigma factor (sigma-70 family)
MLAALVARLGDFDLAEDALSDALESALSHWGRTGLPQSPQGWLLKVAARKAIDRIRRRKSFRDREPMLTRLMEADEADANEPAPEIPDDRLRLIFTCCHPALDAKSRVALTLRTVGGLSTAEIARAFLDREPAMAQRLSRAKAKIAAAGIPFAIPGQDQWDQRLNSVLTVTYLIFNAGYTVGPLADRDLCNEAIFLARLLLQMRPDEPEVAGCLALMLLTHARRCARTDAEGVSIALSQQDRSLWDDAMLAEGRALIRGAFQAGRQGPFQIKAAVADLTSAAAVIDWPQIVSLFDVLGALEPTPVVMLNRAVALAETGALTEALAAIEATAAELADYQPFHAARANVLARLKRTPEARIAYDKAISLAPSISDATFLRQCQKALTG